MCLEWALGNTGIFRPGTRRGAPTKSRKNLGCREGRQGSLPRGLCSWWLAWSSSPACHPNLATGFKSMSFVWIRGSVADKTRWVGLQKRISLSFIKHH